MPIVVDYNDINALGAAAFQAGYQPGYAQSFIQGHESFLNRQQQDKQMLMQEAFRRQDRASQQQFETQARQQQYGYQSQEADTSRQFQAQQADLSRQNQMQEELAKFTLGQQSADANLGRQMQLTGYQQNLEGQRQTQNQQQAFDLKQKAEDQNRKDFISQGMNAGMFQSPEDAGKAYDATQVEKTMAAGPFARRGANGAGGAGAKSDIQKVLGTLSGDVTQDAILAINSGYGSEYLDDLKKASYGRESALKLRNAKSAMYAFANEETPEQVALMALRESDPDLKAMLQQLYMQKVAYGANQQPQSGWGGMQLVPQPRNPVIPGSSSGGPGPGVGGGLPIPGQYQTFDETRFKGISSEDLRRALQWLPSRGAGG